jgi:CTP synthase
MTKYIFITGGVVSGLGKGITAASLGRLLKSRDIKVTIQKFDPYINVDPGTMSPYQHGEVFVTYDGAETDLDLGHYERFIDENLNYNSNITSGKVYWEVLNKERKGEYLGQTIQVIPHITNTIKEKIFLAAKNNNVDVVITEIGGTVGDIESQPFIEAIRQMAFEVGDNNVLYIHVTLIPFLENSYELKTKPTQHSVKELLSLGIQPDIIVCRTSKSISFDMREKLSLFCNVPINCIIQNINCSSPYEVPLLLEKENFAVTVCDRLNLKVKAPNLEMWQSYVYKESKLSQSICIAIVGKYVQLHDAYISIIESLRHAGVYNDVKVDIKWIDAQKIEDSLSDKNNKFINDLFKDIDGIIVPGGFGVRAIEGKIISIKFARENKIPLMGICLGMQCAVIEFARNVVGIKNANTTEVSEDNISPVIDILIDQKDVSHKGGTMRLGEYPCKLSQNSFCEKIYNKNLIYERHRHRFEFNNYFRNQLLEAGLKISGTSPDDKLVEIVELPRDEHPWFIGVQFHPELQSRPNRPHPLFVSFVKETKKKHFGV